MAQRGLKTINFTGELYRANSSTFVEGTNAFTAYSKNGTGNSNTFIKYFTKNVKEANIYAKQARHISNWRVKDGQALVLIDILDLNTRRSLSAVLPSAAKSLDIAFPIKDGKVERYSNTNTTKNDYTVLKDICSLGGYDGYYMDKTESFHSEIGLCSKALKKLVYMKRTASDAPPNIGLRATRKRRMNNNNHNSPRAPRGLAFNINNNNRGNTRRRTHRNNNNANNMNMPTIKRSLF